MFELTAGYLAERIVEHVFVCGGFNTEDDPKNILLLSGIENATLIGYISKDTLLYLLIKSVN